ncbi:hypothetical protein BG011_007162 [Mortierella polycephala]|uniref:Uncharacterized protein n=1 Tax=Mortierella polycephala TaxID=41804 RepID=A0A9P6QDI7_9FUNG|nr:hypothetical protein BG011_007162 [Mortierella polycephala]
MVTQLGRLSRLFASPPSWIRKGGAGMAIGMSVSATIYSKKGLNGSLNSDDPDPMGASVIASSNSNSQFNSNSNSNINSNINSSSSSSPNSDPSSSSSPVIRQVQEVRPVLKTREELQQEQSPVIKELAQAWGMAMEKPSTEDAPPEDQLHEQIQELINSTEIQNAALALQPMDQMAVLSEQVQELRTMMLMMLDAKGAAASSS